MKRWAIICILMITTIRLCGQYFLSGQDPYSGKWKQIETPDFRFIFKEEFTEEAKKYVQSFTSLCPATCNYFDNKPAKIPLIFHNRSVRSNAIVAWAPSRMEIFPKTPSDAYPQLWREQLALHEYRHVSQLTTMKKGTTKALSWLFGQQAEALVLGLYLPFWLLEGDAVFSETINSRTGRGRSPEFLMPLKAQLLERGPLNYDKAVFGSYKHFVPDHYILGYHLVAQGRLLYQDQIWKEIINNSAEKTYTLFPFYFQLKKISGLNKTQFFNRCMINIQKHYAKDSIYKIVVPDTLIKINKHHTSYYSPFITQSNSIIALKKSMDDTDKIVLVNNKGEERCLYRPASIMDKHLDMKKGLLAWAEYRRHPRWEHESFSEIHIFKIHSNTHHKITHKSRYFSPAISPDTNKIAVIENTRQGLSNILILDITNGDILYHYKAQSDEYFLSLSWGKDNNDLLVQALEKEGKSLFRLSLKSGERKQFIYPSDNDFGRAYLSGNHIILSHTLSGKNEIYAIDTSSMEYYRLGNSKYGAFSPSIGPNGHIVYSDFSDQGFNILSIKKERNNYEAIATKKAQNVSFATKILSSKEQVDKPGNKLIPIQEYMVKPYRRLASVFRLHSWAPLAMDIDNMSLAPGISLFSQNTLGNMLAGANYKYDLNEKTSKISANITCMALFPIISIEGSVRGRRTKRINKTGESYTARWTEKEIKLSAEVPLFFSHASSFFYIKPKVNAGISYIDIPDNPDWDFKGGDLKTLSYGLDVYYYTKSSLRDLQPPFGILTNFRYKHSPASTLDAGSVYALQSRILLPGILSHHGIRLDFKYQHIQPSEYVFGSLISYPRGYSGIYSLESLFGGIAYSLPLFYPDWSLPPLAYIKRVKSLLFMEMASLDNTNQEDIPQEIWAAGIELTSDLHALRTLLPIEAGIRLSYHPKENKNFTEFIFALDIASLYLKKNKSNKEFISLKKMMP